MPNTTMRCSRRGHRIFVLTALITGATVALMFAACSDSSGPEPDVIPPTIQGVTATDVYQIWITFDEPVEKVSAEDLGNYTLFAIVTPDSTDTLRTVSGELLSGNRTVLLTTFPMKSTQSHTILIDGIFDESQNRMASRSITFNVELADCPTTPGFICTWAGTGKAAYDGGGQPLRDSHFYWVTDLRFTSTGTYILDWNNHVIRRVTAQNTLETVIGTGFVGDGDEDLKDLEGPPGVPALDVNLNHPTDIIEIPNSGGKLLLSAWHNHKLREYDPSTGLMYVTCGRGAGFAGDGEPFEDARLNQPTQTVFASDGSYYVIDQRNQRIRKISNGLMNTVVGTGIAGYNGENETPLSAQLNFPAGNNPPVAGALAIDAQDRLYISDTLNGRIRVVDFNANTVKTLAGNGNVGFSGDGGAASGASMNNPRDIEFGPDGCLYIADELNNRIRRVDMTTGIIETVVGIGTAGLSGDGGPAKLAELFRPAGIAFGNDGHLYIADTFNHRI
ncbi:MAG: hypothetical protein O7D32_03015, partial [bacterium]|nr:hypothetical protein [bacterium]